MRVFMVAVPSDSLALFRKIRPLPIETYLQQLSQIIGHNRRYIRRDEGPGADPLSGLRNGSKPPPLAPKTRPYVCAPIAGHEACQHIALFQPLTKIGIAVRFPVQHYFLPSGWALNTQTGPLRDHDRAAAWPLLSVASPWPREGRWWDQEV